MPAFDPSPQRFLADASEVSLRATLATTAPELAELPLQVIREPDPERPLWATLGAQLGTDGFAKFALSEQTAVRIWREAQMLELLAERELPVPPLLALGPAPTFVVTGALPGEPLSFDAVSAAAADTVDAIARQLAAFLVALHDPVMLVMATDRLDHLGPPDPAMQPSTAALRERFGALIPADRRPVVARWCDWIDAELSGVSETVLVHADFHPHNQLWDLSEPRLVAVLDLESACRASPEFDFRVLPVFGPSVDLLLATVEHYESLSGRRLSLGRIMALHLLNCLGDALWRTEAGFPLPPPGITAADYVDEAAIRLAAVGLRV